LKIGVKPINVNEGGVKVEGGRKEKKDIVICALLTSEHRGLVTIRRPG
jgi:hypothetical protein